VSRTGNAAPVANDPVTNPANNPTLTLGKRHRPASTLSSESSSADSSLSRAKPPRKRPEFASHHDAHHDDCVDFAATLPRLDLNPKGAWSLTPPDVWRVDSPQTLVEGPSPHLDSTSRKSPAGGELCNSQALDSPRTLVGGPSPRLDLATSLSPSSRLLNKGAEPKVEAESKAFQEIRPGFRWSPSFPRRISTTTMLDMVDYPASCRQSEVGSEPDVRVIRHGRPVDTFTPRDMADIKMAADLFSVIGCGNEAFELYTTLLKGHTSAPMYRGNTDFWYLVIQCVYTADKLDHLFVIQHVIEQELKRFHDTRVDDDHTGGFLFHMLLAHTHSKSADQRGVSHHLSSAREYTRDNDSWFLYMLNRLPQKDISLDLVLYHNALRLRQTGETIDLISPVAFQFTPFSLCPPNPRFESHILKHSPGPFELGWEDRVANPCLGSCLLWCTFKLQDLDSLSRTPDIETFCPNKMAIGWTEANALFFTLWGQWAMGEIHSPADDSPPWMTETQNRMGISPTMLLMLVCRAIHDGYPNGPALATLELELLQRLRHRAKRMLEFTDLQLSRLFLHQYILHHTMTTWPRWRSDVRKLERARANACIEKVLGVTFPNLSPAPDDQVQETMGFANILSRNKDLPAIPESATLPPLAESDSWSGPSSASFLETGRRAALQVQQFERGSFSSMSIPSRSLMRSGSKASSHGTSASELSRSLDSMILSGGSPRRNRGSAQPTAEDHVGLTQSMSETEPDDEREVTRQN